MKPWTLLLTALGWLLFLAAPAYLAVIFALQPADQLGVPPKPEWAHRLLYDDWDMAALALRGLNAHLGRTAGRVDEPPDLPWDEFVAGLGDLTRTYRPTYYLEYPHATLLLFRLGYVWQWDFQKPPAGLADADYKQLAGFPPGNNHEKQLWRQLRRAGQTYMVVFVACQLGLLWVLRQGYEPGAPAAPLWLCVLPAALYFTLNRFDIVPALLTALSLLALARRQTMASAALLALATAVKVYPALLAPLVASYLWQRREDYVRWAAAYAGTLALLLLPVIAFSGWQAFWGPYQFQLNRDPLGPTIYSYLLPQSWAGKTLGPKLFRLGTVLATVLVLMAGRMDSLDSLLRRGAMALIVFVTLPVFYSPQWLLWFLPLVVPVAAKQRWLVVPLVALDLVTYLTFPAAWDGELTRLLQWAAPEWFAQRPGDWLTNKLLGLLTVARFLLLAVLMFMLAWPDVRDWLEAAEEEPEPEPAPV